MQASQSEPGTAPINAGPKPSGSAEYDDWFDVSTVHFEGTEQKNGRDMTLYPGESFDELKDEVRGLGPPVNLRKIEVQWADETREPNPERITGMNCAEVTQDLKERSEDGVKDKLVVYYFEVGDTQGEEKEFEARCRDCHIEHYAHNCDH